MFTSLRFRLWLTYAMVAGVVITIAGAALVVYLLRFPASDRRELLRQRLIANLVVQRSQMLNLPPDAINSTRLEDVLQRADLAVNARLAIFNASGKLLATPAASSAAALPAWSFFPNHRLAAETIFTDANRQQWLYSLTPLGAGDTLLLAAPRPRVPILSLLYEDILPPLVRGVALALALSLLMAVLIARWISGPLNRLAGAAQSVSAGEFHKIRQEGPREVQEVSAAFNEMGERVQASQRSQRDFIANVSHDLKTPLTSIEGFAQAILDGTAEDPPAVKQAAGVIYEEAQRMHGMVTDLLDLARLDAGTAGLEHLSIDLDHLLSKVVEKFKPQARQAQVELLFIPGSTAAAQPATASANPGLPPITGDSDRLVQVFSNLLDNALKFTPPGGVVTLSAWPTGDWVEIRVADTGLGIPAAELERIFERFYQTDKSRRSQSGRGAGLGLAIAREVVLAHGGSIRAENQPSGAEGTGSVFIVRLPVLDLNAVTQVRRKKESPARLPKGA